MFGEAVVNSVTLKISPEKFVRWLQDVLSHGQRDLELEGVAFRLESVQHNPTAIVGRAHDGSVVIEVIGHTVVATTIRDRYPNP